MERILLQELGHSRSHGRDEDSGQTVKLVEGLIGGVYMEGATKAVCRLHRASRCLQHSNKPISPRANRHQLPTQLHMQKKSSW